MDFFKCSFAKEGAFKEGENWTPTEPSPYMPELGIWNWVNCRNGSAFPNMNAGRLRLVRDPINPSRLCLMMLLDAVDPSGDQHCKLYEEVHNVPPVPMVYEAEYYFPVDFQINSWRTLMQWGNYYPSWQPCFGIVSHVWVSGQEGMLFLEQDGYADPQGEKRRWSLGLHYSQVPKNRWVKIRVYIKPSSGWQRDGQVKVWFDGKLVVDVSDICTSSPSAREPEAIGAWGIANYGGLEERGYILVKDVLVTETLTTPPLTPCFIATACGTSNSHLDTLRSFRDRYLPNRLVDAYYLLSPPVADRIRRHENVKTVIRGCVECLAKNIQNSLTLR